MAKPRNNHILINNIPHKICNACTVPLSLDSFQKNAAQHDGLQVTCRKCTTERKRLYRQKLKGTHLQTELDLFINNIPNKKNHIIVRVKGYTETGLKASIQRERSTQNRCIYIWEYEWINRQEQVKNFLYSALGTDTTLYARKCIFKFIDKKEATLFCEQNHIQGKPFINLAIGCYHNDELVGVATFNKHHRGLDEILLNRLCYKKGVSIVGALSKFSKMAKLHFNREIYTFTHNLLSDGSSYIKAGWKKHSDVPPDYFYIKDGKKVGKQGYRGNSHITEKQRAESEGLTRVYDAGKQKLIF